MKFLLAVIGLLFHLNCARAESVAPTARLAEYQASIRPILQELCFRCHGSKKQSGDLRLDTVSPDVTSTAFSVSAWHDTLDQINLGEMPPRDETQLSDTQRKQLVAWIAATLNEAAESKRYADGRVLMRRLTRYEYANTVRDLLGIDFDVAR
jgi:mono/diheme cytochrome c family protein